MRKAGEPAAVPELTERFELNLSACEQAQADRGEYLHVCYDSPPKTVVVRVLVSFLTLRPDRV